MSEFIKKSGRCLCGAVKVTAKVNHSVGACHCGMCRRWNGGPYITVETKDAIFEGEKNITAYSSSEWAERAFCRNCGSHLSYKLKGTDHHFMPLGIFEDESDLVFDHQIFIDRKSKLYDFANKTSNLTEAEVFAKFAPPA